MRVAWFTPLPPVRSGIAAYSAEVLPLVAAHHAVDVFVDAEALAPPHAPPTAGSLAPQAASVAGAGVAVRSAHDFVTRHAVAPYDLVVYQLGNAACHEYQWPYLLRYPGLVVLHDAQLHHGRAYQLLSRGRRDDYRAEFAWSHPDVTPAAAEAAIEAFQGSTYYLWPMLGLVFATARAVAVHSPALAADLADTFPDARVLHVPMGVRAAPRPDAASGAVGRKAPGEVRFAAFGLVTPEKRIPEILRVFARMGRMAPAATLRLVGDRAPHYDVDADVESAGLASRVSVTGYVPDHALDGEYSAADVCLCLRWPTGHETSASWLRALAAGRPTIITDLVHTGDVPALDPRDWTVRHAAVPAADRTDAVAIAIDLMDEEHSLELAMTRLAADADLRRRLGERARAWWESHHTLDRMAAAYLEAMADTAARPAPPPPPLPVHVRADGMDKTTGILRGFGLETPFHTGHR